jgi:hypothetical protein
MLSRSRGTLRAPGASAFGAGGEGQVVKTPIRMMVAAAVVLSCAGTARADDVWEQFAPGDDTCNTNVELVHGIKQTHDLQSTGGLDIDFARVTQRAFRSYEVRVMNSPLRLAELTVPNRVDCAGTVLTAGVPYEGTAHDAVSIRWIAPADGDTYIRTTTTTAVNGASTYDIQLLETSYSIPRFNNTASQATVLLIQNARTYTVSGSLYFFGPTGGILAAQTFSIAERGVLVLNTGAVAGAAGQSGSVIVSHDGGYGALAGKAVALEPATGFTFDTLMVPRAY